MDTDTTETNHPDRSIEEPPLFIRGRCPFVELVDGGLDIR